MLVDELSAVAKGEKSLAVAVETYEKEMKERALQEIPISIKQARMVHSYDTLLEAPFFKLGMHKYREDLAAKNATIEVATQEKVLQPGSPAI